MAEPTETTPAIPLREGGVYFATGEGSCVKGTCAIFVRVEAPKWEWEPDEQHALFVISRQHNVFTVRTPLSKLEAEWTAEYEPPNDDTPIGSAWKLEVITANRERDEALDDLASVRQHLADALEAAKPVEADPEVEAERDALKAAMKEAVRLAPQHADALRDVYRSAKGNAS